MLLYIHNVSLALLNPKKLQIYFFYYQSQKYFLIDIIIRRIEIRISFLLIFFFEYRIAFLTNGHISNLFVNTNNLQYSSERLLKNINNKIALFLI